MKNTREKGERVIKRVRQKGKGEDEETLLPPLSASDAYKLTLRETSGMEKLKKKTMS